MQFKTASKTVVDFLNCFLTYPFTREIISIYSYTARIACGAGSMKRSSVRHMSVPQSRRVCC